MTEKRFWLSPIVYDGEQRFVRDNSLIGEKSMSNNEVVDLLNSLTDENMQLKSELKIYRKVANCSNCKHQNYDWYDDGDEFEICEKGNNNQQMEYHICKEWEEF